MPAEYPTLKVQVAFASKPTDSNLVWTDITAWARTVKTVRGRTRLLRSMAQFQAGTCAIQLDNRDRRFDPTNTSGPYSPNVTPEKVIQVGATWQGKFYPVWTGYVDDWPCVWPGFSEGRIDLTATDLFKSIGILRVLSSGYSQAILGGSPAGYWRLGEPTPLTGQPEPTTAIDSSAAGVNAGYVPKVTVGATGALISDPNTAADFTSGGYLAIPASLAAATVLNAGTDWTIQFWIKTTQASATAYPIMQDQGITGINGPLTLWLVNGQLGLGPTVATGPAVNDGVWHQVTIWASIYGGVIAYLAVDGQQVYYGGVGNTSTPYFDGSPSGLWIGGFGGWKGSVDEVSIFTGANADALAPTGNPLTWVQAAKLHTLASFPAQYTGQRVDQVLDIISFPSGRRRVDTGRTWCQQELTNQNNTKALLYLQRCEQTEQGQFYMGADGAAVFEDRYRRSMSPDADPLAVVGDGGAAYPLTLGEYTSAVTASLPPAPFVSSWLRLQDAPGATSAVDQQRPAVVNQVTGGVTFGVTGPTASTAASFDGTTGWVDVASNQVTLNQGQSEPTSVEIWYKTTWSGAAGTSKPLIWANETSGTVAAIFALMIDGQTGRLYVTWGNQTVPLEDPNPSNDGGWHHAVVTWDGTGSMVLYRDGQPVAAGTPAPTNLGSNHYEMALAAEAGAGIAAQNFAPVTLAELAVYSKQLAASDVGHHYAEGEFVSSQGTTEMPYEMGALTLNFDRQELYNEVPVTRQGGNQQVAQDLASIAAYGDRTVTGGLTELLMASDGDALYCAEWILADTAQPQLRIGDITLNPNTDARLWPLVLGAEIGNIITVNKHNIPGGGPSISVNVRIEGIEHTIDPPYGWKTIWHLSKQSTQPWLLLDDPVSGLLDHGNRWGW